MKRLKELFYVIPIIVISAMILISPEVYSKKAIEGFTVWFTYVLPSLFPFFFFNGILTKTRLSVKISEMLSPMTEKLYSLNGASAYVALISYISGYPIGAKLTKSLYENGLIEKRKILSTALLSSTSGIVFIVGTVGGIMLKSTLYGVIIYLSHILSANIVAFIFKDSSPSRKGFVKMRRSNSQSVLYDVMFESVVSILIVGGYISLFYVIFEAVLSIPFVLSATIRLDTIFCAQLGTSKAILSGVFEVTQGIRGITSLLSNKKIAGIISCGLISFGGLSINAQNLAFLSPEVKPTKYLFAKVLHAMLSALICGFVFLLL